MILIKADSTQLEQRLPVLVRLARNPRQVMLGVGREAGNLLKKHFQAKEQSDVNQLNPGRRQHFWLGVARGVQPAMVSADGLTTTVTIVHPAIAQKVRGGTIIARRVKNLAIPVEPEAYGRSPKTFEAETGKQLFVLKQGNTALLVRRIAGDQRVGIQVEYVLKHSVTQAADPTALPELGVGSSFEQALLQRAQGIVDRQLKDGGLT